MAKGKHSTALFEVINRPARKGVTPPPVITRAPLSAQPTSTSPAPSLGSTPTGNAVEVDRDRHQVSLRVSYTAAAVTLFAIVVVIVLAYVMGRGSNPTPQMASATTEELRNGPANPSVMEVSPSNSSTPAKVTPLSYVAPKQPTPPTTSGPVAAPTNVKRIIGQNYVIMQSYPDEASAKEAQTALLNAGIPCTVERGPSGWVPMSWFSVMGTQPFDRITKNPQLDAYMKAIESVKFAEKSKFKKFEPRAYKWK